jgi:hypothetical protein
MPQTVEGCLPIQIRLNRSPQELERNSKAQVCRKLTFAATGAIWSNSFRVGGFASTFTQGSSFLATHGLNDCNPVGMAGIENARSVDKRMGQMGRILEVLPPLPGLGG